MVFLQNTIWTLSIILVILSIAHSLFLLFKKKYHYKDFSVLSVRIKTWWGMFGVFCFATLFNPIVSLLSLMFLSFFSLKEYFSMMKTRRADRRIFLWAYLVIPVQFYWIFIEWYGMFIVFIPVYVFLLLPLPRMIGKGTLGFLRSVSSTQWGLMLMVFGLSHLAYFQVASPQYGANLVLFLVLLTQVNDVAQFIISVYLGKRKIVPSSNPYITVEGVIGSLVITSLTAFLTYPFLTPFEPMFGIMSGVLISIGGGLGSLTISVLKRDLLLGEGGATYEVNKSYLSRVDSLAYTSPVYLHVIRYFFDFM